MFPFEFYCFFHIDTRPF